MIDITSWINTFLKALFEEFGNRVWFVGLQGSYARGEATKDSDIDMVVILDELSRNEIIRTCFLLSVFCHFCVKSLANTTVYASFLP